MLVLRMMDCASRFDRTNSMSPILQVTECLCCKGDRFRLARIVDYAR